MLVNSNHEVSEASRDGQFCKALLNAEKQSTHPLRCIGAVRSAQEAWKHRQRVLRAKYVNGMAG